MFKTALLCLSVFCFLMPACVLTFEEPTIAFMTLKIYEYNNDMDKKSTGKSCERFAWMGDFCDPMFDVCVSSDASKKCDLFTERIGPFANAKAVVNVLNTGNITLKKFPKTVRVDIKVRDHDDSGSHDHIADFSEYFTPSTKSTMVKLKKTKKFFIAITFEASFRCASDYYGDQCGTYCLGDGNTYSCGKLNGEKICLLPCSNGGNCIFNRSGNRFVCQCPEGFTGQYCAVSSYCTPANNPCLNGAICQLATSPIRPYPYYCVCPPGYQGDRCEGRVVTAQPQPSTLIRQVSTTFTVQPETSTRVTESTSTVSKSTEKPASHTTILIESSEPELTPSLLGMRQKTKDSEKTSSMMRIYLYIGCGLAAVATIAFVIVASFFTLRKPRHPVRAESFEVICDLFDQPTPTPSASLKPRDSADQFGVYYVATDDQDCPELAYERMRV